MAPLSSGITEESGQLPVEPQEISHIKMELLKERDELLVRLVKLELDARTKEYNRLLLEHTLLKTVLQGTQQERDSLLMRLKETPTSTTNAGFHGQNHKLQVTMSQIEEDHAESLHLSGHPLSSFCVSLASQPLSSKPAEEQIEV